MSGSLELKRVLKRKGGGKSMFRGEESRTLKETRSGEGCPEEKKFLKPQRSQEKSHQASDFLHCPDNGGGEIIFKKNEKSQRRNHLIESIKISRVEKEKRRGGNFFGEGWLTSQKLNYSFRQRGLYATEEGRGIGFWGRGKKRLINCRFLSKGQKAEFPFF